MDAWSGLRLEMIQEQLAARRRDAAAERNLPVGRGPGPAPTTRAAVISVRGLRPSTFYLLGR